MTLVSGNTFRRWTSKILSTDTVFRSVQQALHASLDARRAADRNIERVLSVLDIPSRQDIERLESDIHQAHEVLDNVHRRLQRIHKIVERRAAEAKRD
ncbi:MAG: hypothetical protein AAFR88_03810 [Pseudomonadota bacterium]